MWSQKLQMEKSCHTISKSKHTYVRPNSFRDNDRADLFQLFFFPSVRQLWSLITCRRFVIGVSFCSVASVEAKKDTHPSHCVTTIPLMQKVRHRFV